MDLNTAYTTAIAVLAGAIGLLYRDRVKSDERCVAENIRLNSRIDTLSDNQFTLNRIVGRLEGKYIDDLSSESIRTLENK